MKKLLLLACAVVGVCINSMAQTEVRPFQPGVTESGISYFLPQTKIQVVVTAERTIAYPGEFSMYAEKFLRLKNVVHGKTETWKVKTIELSTFGEANPQLAFSITHNIKSLVPLVRSEVVVRYAEPLFAEHKGSVNHFNKRGPPSVC